MDFTGVLLVDPVPESPQLLLDPVAPMIAISDAEYIRSIVMIVSCLDRVSS